MIYWINHPKLYLLIAFVEWHSEFMKMIYCYLEMPLLLQLPTNHNKIHSHNSNNWTRKVPFQVPPRRPNYNRKYKRLKAFYCQRHSSWGGPPIAGHSIRTFRHLTYLCVIITMAKAEPHGNMAQLKKNTAWAGTKIKLKSNGMIMSKGGGAPPAANQPISGHKRAQ